MIGLVLFGLFLIVFGGILLVSVEHDSMYVEMSMAGYIVPVVIMLIGVVLALLPVFM